MSDKTQYLTVAALSENKTQILIELTRLTAQHHCRIAYCHVNQHGEHYALNLLLSGSWSAIAKAEAALTALAQKLSLHLVMQRTSLPSASEPALPYALYITGVDEPSLIHEVMRFFNEENIPVQEILIDTYKTRHTHTVMLNITLRVHIPASLSIADWRERFVVFCDALNLDAMMEPEKI